MTTARPSVAMIALRDMGSALARRLVGAGDSVRVWSRPVRTRHKPNAPAHVHATQSTRLQVGSHALASHHHRRPSTAKRSHDITRVHPSSSVIRFVRRMHAVVNYLQFKDPIGTRGSLAHWPTSATCRADHRLDRHPVTPTRSRVRCALASNHLHRPTRSERR
jgi:hypothetical protein